MPDSLQLCATAQCAGSLSWNDPSTSRPSAVLLCRSEASVRSVHWGTYGHHSVSDSLHDVLFWKNPKKVKQGAIFSLDCIASPCGTSLLMFQRRICVGAFSTTSPSLERTSSMSVDAHQPRWHSDLSELARKLKINSKPTSRFSIRSFLAQFRSISVVAPLSWYLNSDMKSTVQV